jgi:LTXXQ motif family protein
MLNRLRWEMTAAGAFFPTRHTAARGPAPTLSEPQRVAFYKLVAASLPAADTLASACPADAGLTPPARMGIMRQRLASVHAATAAIRPALLWFYAALDQGQKVRFAEVS